MTDDDPNALRNLEIEKLKTYQRDRDLQQCGVKIDEAVQGITDEDRKLIINKSCAR